jgi:ribonuclease HI
MKIDCYSDGSATTSQNAGGWGSVIIIDGLLHKELAGHLEKATNNDSELVGAIKGLTYVLEYISTLGGSFPLELDVTLISDSEIILNWANGTYRFKQTEKMFLYEELRRLVKKLNVKTKWVRGHSGDVFNERCDKLANNARKNIYTSALDKPSPIVDTRIGTKKAGVVCLWYMNQLKLVDLDNGIVENYNREIHGKRGSAIQIREEKDR